MVKRTSPTDATGRPWSKVGTLGVLWLSALAAMAGCGNDDAILNPGGTLPPVASTTTLPPSETTIEPFVITHKLTAGETLRSVAQEYLVPLEILVEYNREGLGGNVNNVPIGTEITIPPHRWIETLPASATTTPATEG